MAIPAPDAAEAESWLTITLEFIRLHQEWSAAMFAIMAFLESMVVIGVFVPATTIMIACGPLVATGVLPFADLFIGGVIGAAMGDTLSFWLGQWMGPRASTIWPFRDNPSILIKAGQMFQRFGWFAVFAGRFIGPLRATIPTAAGMLAMRQWQFQLVNVGSALVWVPALLAPGAAIGWIWTLVEGGRIGDAVGLGLGLVVALGIAWIVGSRIVRALSNGTHDKTAD